MNHIHSTSTTKRGNKYNTRSTKLANGYSQVLADRDISNKLGIGLDFMSEGELQLAIQKHSQRKFKESDLLRLAVKGTTDELNGIRYLVKTITIEHPVDKGYFKKVLVLNETGRTILRKKSVELNVKKNLQ